MTTCFPRTSDWEKGTEENISNIDDCFCPNCQGGKAKTVIFPTNIPMFRQIYIMTLHCEECNFRNAEVNFGGEIQERGKLISFQINCRNDLNRQMIKSDFCTLTIPSLEFEIPPSTQRGTISTIEGFLLRAAENLEKQQKERLQLGDLENFYRCHHVVKKLNFMAGKEHIKELEEYDELQKNAEDSDDSFIPFEPFQIILDDTSGNSFIENIHAPNEDPQMKIKDYVRSPTQDMSLGLQPSKEAINDGIIDDTNPSHKNHSNNPLNKTSITSSQMEKINQFSNIWGNKEVMKFPTTCPSCSMPGETNMCTTEIPHFKEIIIMSFLCENCGYRSNEIKGGGEVSKYGTTFTLHVTGNEDLEREVLKSETAGVCIPEIDFKMDEGGLDSVYTTVEGLIEKIYNRLKNANPFPHGDATIKQHRGNDGEEFSEPCPQTKRYLQFLTNLDDMKNGKKFPFTLLINDPLSNSFIGLTPKDAIKLSLTDDKNDLNLQSFLDHGIEIDQFERSFEENESLGLNDINTQEYDKKKRGKNFQRHDCTGLPEHFFQLEKSRQSDHPHNVGLGTSEGDDTAMGFESIVYAVPKIVSSSITKDDKIDI